MFEDFYLNKRKEKYKFIETLIVCLKERRSFINRGKFVVSIGS